MKRLTAAALLLGLLAGMGAANADEVLGRNAVTYSAKRHVGSDPRPRAWCGWGLKRYFGLTDRRLNKASNWATLFGTPASGPETGTVVVWRHHVGRIVRLTKPGFAVVHSFNDGNAERTRERSLKGAIAFRHPPMVMGALQ
jgi:hypothetical protein